MAKKGLSILGSTGSIGRQTLEVAGTYPDRYRVVALAAGRNLDVLVQQVRRFCPEMVGVADEATRQEFRSRLPGWSGPILAGEEGLAEAATWPTADLVVTAVVGVVGLKPTLLALQRGKGVALANKETLVAGGDLVMKEVQTRGRQLLPVDSEHSAVFQCLQGQSQRDLARIILTASGGPFHGQESRDLAGVTAEGALAHPNWRMGPKITVDSATLMNKGLEVIEAHHLFGVDYQDIDVVVHRQSIVHSLVEFRDGSVLAQLGWPDMKLPIRYALSYPERLPGDNPSLDLVRVGQLTFETPDRNTFPALALAYRAGQTGGTMPAVLNAANEVAVGFFLAGRLRFLQIADITRRVMDQHIPLTPRTLEDILKVDTWAREEATRLVGVNP
ncbi:MAG: 1-deoxy-D-xylulose-5-phosphate reductoisomerase [Firmicutes bacterium]|nr:1-deoxy-D-xylulose-5-phosphate reductoisomerase [Bacillota bacterium]MCL5038591.1 1-deoxy-D-xylulose-5-phosphate reductoisomerase [Bacillota bacterium]